MAKCRGMLMTVVNAIYIQRFLLSLWQFLCRHIAEANWKNLKSSWHFIADILSTWISKAALLHNFYWKSKEDSFQGRPVQTDALYDTQFSCLFLEFSNFKSYVCEQKAELSQEYSGKGKSNSLTYLMHKNTKQENNWKR